MSPTTSATVPAALDGVRADRVVAQIFGLTRSVARQLVEDGKVRTADGPLTAKEPVAAGADLVAEIPEPSPPLTPAPVDFAVPYADEDVLVVDKPAGVVVHPGAGTRQPTLVAGLVHRFAELSSMEEQRWGLVHRLDRDTSGLLVVARSADAHRTLQRAMKERRIVRTYLALVHGVPESGRGTVDAPIGRDPNHPTRMAVQRDGRAARTHFRRLTVWDDLALLEVGLETGRTHQIRVHLASIGHPVVGDRSYGGRRRPTPADTGRQWLHAAHLEFAHPTHGSPVTVGSTLPPELAHALDLLAAPQSGAIDEWRDVVGATTPSPEVA